MVRGFLERGQHEHTVFHFGDAKAGDTKYLTLLEISSCCII